MNIVDNNGKLVYHYTTKETLLKILDNVSEGRFYLWAHNVFNMNDPKEVAYGFEKLWKLLPVIERRLDIEEDLKLSNIWNWDRTKTSQKLNEFLICEYSKLSNVPHAISLTSRGDSIPMWVMYADKGKGVAIGIDVANVFSWIDNGMIKREYEFKLDVPHAIRISYNASLNNETLINYIKINYMHYLDIVCKIDDWEKMKMFQFKSLLNMLLVPSALIKHPAFKYENEWRIITGKDDLSNPDTHVNVGIPLSSLKKIIIGPCLDKKLAMQEIRAKTEPVWGKDIKIIPSKVPLRYK